MASRSSTAESIRLSPLNGETVLNTDKKHDSMDALAESIVAEGMAQYDKINAAMGLGPMTAEERADYIEQVTKSERLATPEDLKEFEEQFAQGSGEEKIERNEENPRFLRIRQALGRAAAGKMSPARKLITGIKKGWNKVHDEARIATWKLVSKMPGMMTAEEMQAKYDAHMLKYAKNEDDGRLKAGWKHLRRNQEKYAFYTLASGMGALAVARYTGVDWSLEAKPAPRVVEAESLNIEVQPMVYTSSMIVAGGRGQGGIGPQFAAPVGELQAKGYAEGIDVQTVDVKYPANIYPVDPMRMDESLNIGTTDMYAKYKATPPGMPVNLIGYSEGSGVAIQTANRIAAENGGALPPNVHLTLVGTPYAEGGAFDSPFTKGMMGAALNHMGIPTDMPLPPGTKVVYYDTDFWANSGNQVPTSQLRQLVELGFGGHDVPDMNGVPARVFTDSQGVEHVVYTRNDVILQHLQNQGLYVADTAAANRAINALFPLDGTKPNVDLFTQELATTLSKNPDPISPMVADFIRNMSPEMKAAAQNGMDGFNNIAAGAAKIQAGDPIGGWNQMMQGFRELSAAVPKTDHSHSSVSELVGHGISDFMFKLTGHDFSGPINDIVRQLEEARNNPKAVTAPVPQEVQQQIVDMTKEAANNVPVNPETGNAENPLKDLIEKFTKPAEQPVAGGDMPQHSAAPKLDEVVKDIVDDFLPDHHPETPATPEVTTPVVPQPEIQAPEVPEAPAPVAETPEVRAPRSETPIKDFVEQYIPKHEEKPEPAPVVTPEPAPAPEPVVVPEVQAPAPEPTPAPAFVPEPAPAPAPVTPPQLPEVPAPAPAPAPSHDRPTPIKDFLENVFKKNDNPAPAIDLPEPSRIIPDLEIPAPAEAPAGGDFFAKLFGGNKS